MVALMGHADDGKTLRGHYDRYRLGSVALEQRPGEAVTDLLVRWIEGDDAQSAEAKLGS